MPLPITFDAETNLALYRTFAQPFVKAWAAPVSALMAQMHRDLSEWVHPQLHRWITVREALRIQSFHDGFVLHGSEWQQLKQVGNAVPPLLGRVPAMAAANVLLRLGRQKSNYRPKGQASLFEAAFA